jgi:hypothetical protein
MRQCGRTPVGLGSGWVHDCGAAGRLAGNGATYSCRVRGAGQPRNRGHDGRPFQGLQTAAGVASGGGQLDTFTGRAEQAEPRSCRARPVHRMLRRRASTRRAPSTRGWRGLARRQTHNGMSTTALGVGMALAVHLAPGCSSAGGSETCVHVERAGSSCRASATGPVGAQPTAAPTTPSKNSVRTTIRPAVRFPSDGVMAVEPAVAWHMARTSSWRVNRMDGLYRGACHLCSAVCFATSENRCQGVFEQAVFSLGFNASASCHMCSEVTTGACVRLLEDAHLPPAAQRKKRRLQ